MRHFTPFALGAATLFCGVAAASFTIGPAGLRAEPFESAIQFSIRQQRQRSGGDYAREPRRVERVPGFFREFFDGFRRAEPRSESHRVAERPDLKRAVCRRQCDGAQLVLGFVSTSSEKRNAQAMCEVAGGGAATKLSFETFVPGAGFDAPQIARVSDSLLEGRAALSAAPDHLAPAPAGCAPAGEPMTVPILHDATLRKGDVVATVDGFKVFVGKGKPPFRSGDFVALEKTKRADGELRRMRVADR